VKALFEDEEKLEITIKPVSDFTFKLNENKEEYHSRINSAILNLESDKDTITFSKEEYENLIENLMSKK
jgi:glucose-6-phosphate 1-dehydrogenase